VNLQTIISHTLAGVRVGLCSAAVLQLSFGATLAAEAEGRSAQTRTPIKHVIVIIGENRSFDHVFATYQPKNGESVWNLLSEGIIKADGTPGANFYKAEQHAAADPTADAFLLSPPKTSFKNNVLPAPLVGGPSQGGKPAASYIPGNSLSVAKASENGLADDYYQYLVGGGALLKAHTPDLRIKDVEALPPGPFQLTSASFHYNDYAASPVHRFYQMWQQLDCSIAHITPEKPSGCDASLFSWVETTVGAGANGLAPPANFSTEYSPTGTTTGEGSTSLGFYNVQRGDAPYLKQLADEYSMSDNFHQSVDGGTGANHIMLGHGDAIWYSDGEGHAKKPPEGVSTGTTANPATLSEIENPNPRPGTDNWYTDDGYGGGSYGSPAYGGGSYSDCSDPTQPGVASVVNYLQSLPHPIDPHCETGHYYLLNNYNPGYFGNGKNASKDTSPDNTAFTIPPSSTPSIGDSLLAAKISWKYYGDQWNNYVPDPYQLNYGAVGPKSDEYCNICNPFQYDTSIMADEAVRTAHIQDTANLYEDIAKGTLPAVSFVKPSGLVDGHPASSKLNLFEGFTKKIVDAVRANPELWKDTAIFVTFDEGGGYYDSGYVQPLDFFGDGTRIPLLVVSRYTKSGHVSHEYADHVSILKFIERNWALKPVSFRSRDNYPNPITTKTNPYVPENTPAIGDLFDLFDFTAQ
jgi:phospholipase C